VVIEMIKCNDMSLFLLHIYLRKAGYSDIAKLFSQFTCKIIIDCQTSMSMMCYDPKGT